MTTQNISLAAQPKVESPNWLALGAKATAGLVWMWSSLARDSRRLLDLNAVQETGKVVDYYYAGLQCVSLAQIRGSASTGRCHDFDANFRPRRSHSESRWAGIAAARRRGVKMPPVTLVQVGQFYFVEDGHHRISVASAWNEQTIEAEVTVWCVA